MRSCVGVVTNIVGLGSTAFSTIGFNTTYPGNRGEGFDHLSGISSAVYEKESGKTTLKALGYTPKVGDLVEVRDMLFSCSYGPNSPHRWAGGTASNAVQSGGNYTHTFVSAVENGVTSNLGNLPNSVTDITYDASTGDMVITSAAHNLTTSNTISIADNALSFTCTMDGNTATKTYPRSTDPASGQALAITAVTTNTFTVNVGASPIVNHDVTDANYNPSTGVLELTIGSHSLTTGTSIRIAANSLTFTCGMDNHATLHTYPRTSDPFYNTAINIDSVTATTITVNVGAAGGSTGTARFPSGYFGYEFYVTKVHSDNSFDVYTGVSTIPHTYVSDGYIVNRSMNITQADYTNTTGIVTITSPGIKLRSGDLVTLRDMEFACSSGAATTTIFPSGNNGYAFRVLSADNENDTFTVNVGTSSVDHTYVVGGTVTPPYSRGVGNIVQGPYTRNCTNFIPNSIGMKVDGFEAEPGDLPDIGVTGTMSVDSYTQYNQGGIGVSITNGAYSQLVSIFTICNDTAIFTASGGQCDLTNSNSSFGRLGLVADGVGDETSKSIYRYTGISSGIAEVEQDTITVSGVGSYRPYDGQALYFGELYYTVQKIEVTDGGSGYIAPPIVTISDPEGPNGIVCEGSPNIDASGRVTSVDIISAGSQYLANPTVTFTGGGGVGAAATTTIYPLYYSIESATKPVAGISTIVLNQNLNNTVGSGTTVYFSRVSLQITSSHSFEWVGAGNNIFSAKPGLGGVVITENEVVMNNGGQVVYTSTDQAGNFKIGDQFTINQLTGTISGRAFSQSLLNTVTPLILAIG